MTCDDVHDRLVDALTADLPVGAEATAHLDGCAACRAEAQVLRSLVTRVRSAVTPGATDDTAPPPLADVLEAARTRARPRRVARWLLQAAALLAAGLLGVTLDRALVRAPEAPPAAGPAAPRALDTTVREALAERPGGLAASLALLDALSAPSR